MQKVITISGIQCRVVCPRHRRAISRLDDIHLSDRDPVARTLENAPVSPGNVDRFIDAHAAQRLRDKMDPNAQVPNFTCRIQPLFQEKIALDGLQPPQLATTSFDYSPFDVNNMPGMRRKHGTAGGAVANASCRPSRSSPRPPWTRSHPPAASQRGLPANPGSGQRCAACRRGIHDSMEHIFTPNGKLRLVPQARSTAAALAGGVSDPGNHGLSIRNDQRDWSKDEADRDSQRRRFARLSRRRQQKCRSGVSVCPRQTPQDHRSSGFPDRDCRRGLERPRSSFCPASTNPPNPVRIRRIKMAGR